MFTNRILIINDVTGYGRVSSFAMLPIFTKYKLHPYVLPTALVSNATEYGSPVILNTDEFMRASIDRWNELNFKFDIITTGFINSAGQVDTILSLINSQDNPFVIVDPIMADSGEIYEGMYEDVVNCNRRLAEVANILLPNLTEAELLSGKFLGRSSLQDDEYEELISSLSELCPNNIVISACCSTDGRHFNLIYSSDDKSIEKQYYDYIPAHFVGTGDVFSAVIVSEYTKGSSLSNAVRIASAFIRELILDNKDNPDHYDIMLETSIDKLSSL